VFEFKGQFPIFSYLINNQPFYFANLARKTMLDQWGISKIISAHKKRKQDSYRKL
jgi:hypothetical protein